VPGPAERASCAPWLHAELRLIRPALIIPVGRLAIDALLGPLPLDQVIGREHRVDAGIMGADAWRASGRPDGVAVPLPHPSGASSWIHAPGHRELLDRALELISVRWRQATAGRRVA
jgi:uracil-DNA glycosylase